MQIYVTIPDIGLSTPGRQLRAFTKIRNLDPGHSKRITLRMDKYAISFWDTEKQCWRASMGRYGIFVGKSSEDIVLEDSFVLKKEITWKGL